MRAPSREAIAGYLFASPVILGLLIWVIGPMIGSLLISFTDWNVLTPPRLIGLLNYVRLFTTDLFFRGSLAVTTYFVILNVTLTILYSLVLAMLLNQKIRGRGSTGPSFIFPPSSRSSQAAFSGSGCTILTSASSMISCTPSGSANPCGSSARPPWCLPSCSCPSGEGRATPS